jgi:DNA replication protein DnaC
MLLKVNGLLEQLKFRGMAAILDETLAKAQADAIPIETVLYQLLAEEYRYRQEKALAYRIKQAKLPWSWALETFPFSRQPGVNKAQIMSLAGLDFLQRGNNLIMIGPPGVGKSGLAIALTRKALLAGHRARYYNAQDLLDELYASLADRTTPRLLKRLADYDLLLIDELGYLSLKPEQTNAFFKLMELRYNRKSTLITTNLDFPEWYDLFKRKPLVDALLDRLRHHCITIKIDGPSLRTAEN